MPDEPQESILKDSGKPCTHCGNFTYSQAKLVTSNGPIYLEAKNRSWADRFKQKGKSAVIVRVCTKCGFLRGFAEDLDILIQADPPPFK